jgi:hypothetical protein
MASTLARTPEERLALALSWNKMAGRLAGAGAAPGAGSGASAGRGRPRAPGGSGRGRSSVRR